MSSAALSVADRVEEGGEAVKLGVARAEAFELREVDAEPGMSKAFPSQQAVCR